MSRHIARDVLSRMNGVESIVTAAHVQHIVEDLQALAGVTDQSLEEAAADIRMAHLMDSYGYQPQTEAQPKPFAYADGVAIIPVHGTLINRFAYSWSFVTGYNFVRKQKNLANADPDVKLIVYDVNSYGGEAAGCFELADELRDDREIKPSLAVVDSNCCSAAYALASACSRLVVTPSGQAGSIGVIAMHMSLQGALEQAGIDVTIFAKGARKADGNPYKRLSREASSEIEASIEQRYEELVELVAKNRDLDADAIRGTESRCYRASEALDLKLIDAVMTPTDAVASFLAEMGNDDVAEDDGDEKLMATEAETTATATAATDARIAEKARVKGISTHAEAAKRPKLAAHLALDTDLSVEAAASILASAAEETPAPKEEPAKEEPAKEVPAKEEPAAKGSGAFKEAMGKDKHPEIGADVNDTDGSGSGPSRAQLAMGYAGVSTKKDDNARTH